MKDTWDTILLENLGKFKNGLNFNNTDMGQGLGIINVKDLYDDNPNID